MGICHRILVFSNRRITADLARAEFSEERILAAAYQEYVHAPLPTGAPPAAHAG
jgi:ribose transport system ATP-binding protein